jgi:predicted CXXCH cytochrome family protein
VLIWLPQISIIINTISPLETVIISYGGGIKLRETEGSRPSCQSTVTNLEYYMINFIFVVAVAVFGLSDISFAFHDGGVAECVGCHEMHNATGSSLLIAVDQSSTCLVCHGASGQSSYHVATTDADMPVGTPPANETPGGDFGWLHKTYMFTVRGAASSDMGNTHGHNIIAAGYSSGYTVDPSNPTAPGGTFSSSQLSCVSCHDQHGKGRWTMAGTYSKTSGAIYTSGSYGSIPTIFSSEVLSTGVYRLLRAGDTVSGVTFPATPPVAVANSNYNRSEYYTQTRTAYSSGMSGWCGTCHPDIHSSNVGSNGTLTHPTDRQLSGTVIGTYNSYVKSGLMTGSPATSYLSLVPYEEGLTYSTANINTLKSHAQTNDSYLNGPANGNGHSPKEQVMCLSCHRAHASGWPKMLRWNNEVTTITVAGAYPTGNDSGWGRSLTEASKAYYDRNATKFSNYQRSLCNKCHAKD